MYTFTTLWTLLRVMQNLIYIGLTPQWNNPLTTRLRQLKQVRISLIACAVFSFLQQYFPRLSSLSSWWKPHQIARLSRTDILMYKVCKILQASANLILLHRFIFIKNKTFSRLITQEEAILHQSLVDVKYNCCSRGCWSWWNAQNLI